MNFARAFRCAECGRGILARGYHARRPGDTESTSVICKHCGNDGWIAAIGRQVSHPDYAWWKPWTWMLPDQWEWRKEAKPQAEHGPNVVPFRR